MHKFLIPLVACLFGMATLYAQVPEVISVPYPFSPNYTSSNADAICNNAGTFTLGQFIGQSNDTALDTIYLCQGDSIFIDHNGDYDLSGDPVGATPPGIAWAFYTCPPTIIGDNYQNLLTNEPCLLLAAGNPVYAFGQANGDIWFFNSGNLQTLYNGGQPVLIHFAPVTVDNFSPIQPYESNIVGAPPGPCVNVNTSVAFEVVYLNAIQESGVVTNFGDDCIGKFRISGGYPEWNSSARYTIDISLASDPSVKALISNPVDQIGDDADIIFYVTQPGIYNVTVEDGKSCGHTFQIAMNGCNSGDNVVISMPDTLSPPGSQICVPVTASGFQIVGASFALSWDPALLSYTVVQNPNPAIGTFNANNLNTFETAQGNLGVIIYDQDNLGNVITIPDGESLFDLCFTVIGPLDSCSSLSVTNDPSQINLEDENGNTLPLTVENGQICVNYLPLSVLIAVTDTVCTNPTSASIEVTASGAIEGYEVVINKLVTGPTYSGNIAASGGKYVRTGLTSGTYSVCVTDNNGGGTIVFCDTITLNIPTIGASLQNTQRPTCNGDMDGIVTAIVSLDGTSVPNPGPNFTFSWSPALNPSGPVYNNAKAGFYTVTVTDQTTGCTATASGTLDQPALITVPNQNLTITPASCTGLDDGAITLVPQGGTPFPGGEYQYNWEYVCGVGGSVQGPTGQDSVIAISGLVACNWQVTLTDANGCTAEFEYVVTNQREVNLSLTSPTPILTNCFSDSTASICVQITETPASANPSYFFFWTPIGFPQSTPGGPLSSCYDNLPAGTYHVLAVDAIGCFDTATFQVISPEEFRLDTISLQNPGCVLQNNGSIKVQGFGGTGGPNYTYNWSTSNAGNMVMNLPPGNYSVTGTDAKGCVDSLAFTLKLPDPPAITQVDSTAVKCGSDGCISITAPTGVVFNWASAGGQTLPATSAICNLQGDTFYLTVTDAQGCTTLDTFSLAGVTPLSISDTNFIEPACFGYTDGSIGVTVVNGTPFAGGTYNYQWSDPAGQITATMVDVPAGDYTVTITDSKGCELIDTFTLAEPPQILVTHTPPVPVSCFGVCDGSTSLTVVYADGTSGTFNFVWSDVGAGGAARNNLCADTISVIAIDGNNCFGTDTLIVTGPPQVSYDTLYTIPTTCFGGDDGQAVVQGAGGNGGPYTYAWNDPLNQATSTATNLTADEWAVTITDKNGCTGVYVAEVTEPAEIVVTLDDQASSDVICFGEASGTLGVNATGGNPGGYTYAWTDADSVSIGNAQVIEDLPSGTYFVTVTDTKGCTGVLQNLAVNEPAGGPVSGTYLPWEALLCFGDETTLFIDTIVGGAGGPYQFSLDFGVTLNPDFPVSMGGGEHYITYYDRLGCEHTDTITVFEPNQIEVSFSPDVDEIELGDTTYQLIPIIKNAVVDTFIWSPGDKLHYPNNLTPFVYTFESVTYTLSVFDANGCEGVGSVTINVDPNRNVYIPNAFFPGNPGGLNDHFNPQIGLGVEKVNYMRIYDRWGALMFEREGFYPNNDNLSEGWDGRYKGDYVNPAVFVYAIEVKFLDGKVLLYRGDVTVVR